MFLIPAVPQPTQMDGRITQTLHVLLACPRPVGWRPVRSGLRRLRVGVDIAELAAEQISSRPSHHNPSKHGCVGCRIATRSNCWSDLWQMTIRTIGMPSSSSATQAVERMAEQASGRPGARRTVEQLLVAAARQAAVRKRAAAEKAERERQRLARARSAARARYLDGLVGHVDELWQRAEALITTRRPVDYEAA